jgi:hypothetical protein
MDVYLAPASKTLEVVDWRRDQGEDEHAEVKMHTTDKSSIGFKFT